MKIIKSTNIITAIDNKFINNLTLFRRTLLGSVYFAGKDKEFIFKYPQFISLNNRNNIFIFLKKMGYPHIPSFYRKRLMGITIIMQRFVRGKKASTIKNLNHREIKLMALAIARLHNIKLTNKKSISKFLEIILYRTEHTIRNCVFFKDCFKKCSLYNEFLSLKNQFYSIKKEMTVNMIFKEKIRYSLLHGDLHLGHFIFVKDRVYLIDWDFMTVGDPAFDIAILYQTTGLSFVNFLKSYGEYIPVNSDFVKRISYYRKMRLLSCALQQLLTIATFKGIFFDDVIRKSAALSFKKLLKDMNLFKT